MSLDGKLAIITVIILVVPVLVGLPIHYFLLSLFGAFFATLLTIARIYAREAPNTVKDLLELAVFSVGFPLFLIVAKTGGHISVYIPSAIVGLLIELPFIALSAITLLLAVKSRGFKPREQNGITK